MAGRLNRLGRVWACIRDHPRSSVGVVALTTAIPAVLKLLDLVGRIEDAKTLWRMAVSALLALLGMSVWLVLAASIGALMLFIFQDLWVPHWPKIRQWVARWRTSPFECEPIPGQFISPITMKSGYIVAQLRVRNRSAKTLRKCSVRVQAISLISENGFVTDKWGIPSVQPEHLRWSEAEAAEGERRTLIDIPPQCDRTADVAAYKRDDTPHAFSLLTADYQSVTGYGRGWWKLVLRIECATDGVAPLDASFLLGYHDRKSPPAPIEFYCWEGRGERLVAALKKQAEERRAVRQAKRLAENAQESPSSSSQGPATDCTVSIRDRSALAVEHGAEYDH